MATHTLKRVLDNGVTVRNSEQDVTASSVIGIEESIPDSSTDLQIALAFDKDDLQYIYILSDQAITLEFNDGTTGVPTIVLAAGHAFEWSASDAYFANPFAAANVTTLYVTNASGAAAALTIDGLVDATP